jgi:aminoglycoside phosphotransferase (APT) family kinase protein
MTSSASTPTSVATSQQLEATLPAVVSELVADRVDRIAGLTPLSGGTSRDTWAFDACTRSGAVLPLILQLRRTVSMGSGLPVATEAGLLRAAASARAPVARLVGADPTSGALGAPFLLLERIPGETIPQRLLRQPEYAAARGRLAHQYGAALAYLQQTPLDAIPRLEVEDPLARYRAVLDQIGSPHPALELGFRWLVRHRPPRGRPVLVHGDFRNGNGIVNEGGLVAVIDFELAHIGDPLEDMGWFCIRAWRFGEAPQAGGYGAIDDFVAGYVRGGGQPVDRDALKWWIVLGTVRWAVICLMQGETHLSGHRRSVELAAVGRRTCEPEFDLMLLLP